MDFIDDDMAILCFEKMSGEMIGRTTVSTTNSGPLYASVVMSSGPCTVRMNWSRSIYDSHGLDRDWVSVVDKSCTGLLLLCKNDMIVNLPETVVSGCGLC